MSSEMPDGRPTAQLRSQLIVRYPIINLCEKKFPTSMDSAWHFLSDQPLLGLLSLSDCLISYHSAATWSLILQRLLGLLYQRLLDLLHRRVLGLLSLLRATAIHRISMS